MSKQDKPGNRIRPTPVLSTEELQATINKYRKQEDTLRELITNNEKENLSENQREMVANLRSLLSDIEANRETAENELRRRREAEDNPNQP